MFCLQWFGGIFTLRLRWTVCHARCAQL